MNLASISSWPLGASLVYSASIQEQHDSTIADGCFVFTESRGPCLFSFVWAASVKKCLLVRYLTMYAFGFFGSFVIHLM
ncbi:hypothetical protein E2542_SST00155 [Spatholobus suberectus]|nr:hypothetical protein E2542_SST00155 [Spatholobus suberectus]